MSNQSAGSHVHWPYGYDEVDVTNDEVSLGIHAMKGTARGKSSSWDIRFPNDKFVASEAVTLEHMRELGAL